MALKLKTKHYDNEGLISNIDFITVLSTSIVRFFLFVMVLFVVYPVFSQTQRNRSSLTMSDWEQPAQRTSGFVPDQYSATTLRNVPKHEDAGYWANAMDDGEKTKMVVLHFKNVSSTLEFNYMNNDRMLSILDRTFSDQSLLERMDYVTITGAASPDGYLERNERLAEGRALAIKNYIVNIHPHVNRDRIIIYSSGEDWDGLRRLVEEDYNIPNRREALNILDMSLSGDEKRKKLQQLAAGRTYRYMLDNTFPYLRGGVACMIYYKQLPERKENYTVTNESDQVTNYANYNQSGQITNYNIAANEVNIVNNNARSLATERNTIVTDRNTIITDRNSITTDRNAIATERNTIRRSEYDNQYQMPKRAVLSQYDTPLSRNNQYTNYSYRNDYKNAVNQRYKTDLYDYERLYEKTLVAVKTNLLFDAVTAINLELEVPMGQSWSLAGEYIFPWWLRENKQNSFELISGALELRHWFGYRENRFQLTGWYGGVFVGGGYYDWERNTKGYQGEFFNAGLSGGYAHAISRDGRWRMEYALGAGLFRTKYREYDAKFGYDDEWHLIHRTSGTFKFFGPLRAKISLSLALNRYTERKKQIVSPLNY